MEIYKAQRRRRRRGFYFINYFLRDFNCKNYSLVGKRERHFSLMECDTCVTVSNDAGKKREVKDYVIKMMLLVNQW